MSGAKKKAADKPAREPDEDIWNLSLYVAGQSAKCVAAVRNLNAFCEAHLAGRYRPGRRSGSWYQDKT